MTATIKELSYVGIEASDLDAWSRFLSQLLGIMPARVEEDLRTFRLDDYVHRTIVERGPKNDISFAGYDCGSHADLDEVVELLRSNGHDVVEGDAALAAQRGVARIYVTHDPEGIRVELINGLAKADEPYHNEVNQYGFQTSRAAPGTCSCSARPAVASGCWSSTAISASSSPTTSRRRWPPASTSMPPSPTATVATTPSPSRKHRPRSSCTTS